VSGRLAVAAWVLVAALTAAATVLAGGQDVADTVLYGLLTMALATSGLVVLWRQPGQPIGRLFVGLAFWLAVTELGEGYGYRAATSDLPAGAVGEWVITWSWIVELTVWAIVFALFPDGRLPSRRWRFVPWIAIAGCALAIPGYALGHDEDASFTSATGNPFAVDSPVIGALFAVGTALLMVALVASLISLVLRLRRSQGVERQQLKWFAYAAASLVLVTPFAIAFFQESVAIQLLIALASLRYRRYDIDVVINRTLVYGALTATLAGTYLAGVLLLQFALSVFTEGSGLAVAGSTLAVAAVFRPARARIQALVDRRFFRRRYDAARTLGAFGLRARDEVDLDALGHELQAVVHATMAPAHLSLWLRVPETDR